MRKFNIVFMVFIVALMAIFVVLAYNMAFPKSFFDSELQKTIDFEGLSMAFEDVSIGFEDVSIAFEDLYVRFEDLYVFNFAVQIFTF